MTTNLLLEGFIHQLQQLVVDLGPAGPTNRAVCPFYEDIPIADRLDPHLGTCDTLHAPEYEPRLRGHTPTTFTCPHAGLNAYWCEHPTCEQWFCSVSGELRSIRVSYGNTLPQDSQVVCNNVHGVLTCAGCGMSTVIAPWIISNYDTERWPGPPPSYHCANSDCNGEGFCDTCWAIQGGCSCDECQDDGYDTDDSTCGCDSCREGSETRAHLCDPDSEAGESRQVCPGCGNPNNHLDLFTERFVCACRIRTIIDQDNVDWPRFVLAGPVEGARHVTHKTVERMRS